MRLSYYPNLSNGGKGRPFLRTTRLPQGMNRIDDTGKDCDCWRPAGRHEDISILKGEIVVSQQFIRFLSTKIKP